MLVLGLGTSPKKLLLIRQSSTGDTLEKLKNELVRYQAANNVRNSNVEMLALTPTVSQQDLQKLTARGVKRLDMSPRNEILSFWQSDAFKLVAPYEAHRIGKKTTAQMTPQQAAGKFSVELMKALRTQPRLLNALNQAATL